MVPVFVSLEWVETGGNQTCRRFMNVHHIIGIRPTNDNMQTEIYCTGDVKTTVGLRYEDVIDAIQRKLRVFEGGCSV